MIIRIQCNESKFAMAVCILNDVGKSNFFARSTRFSDTPRAPWSKWDAQVSSILELYAGQEDFPGMELSTVIFDIMVHYAEVQGKIIDGSAQAALFAVRHFLVEKLQGQPVLQDIDVLFTQASRVLDLTFSHPADSLHVLVQTGEETNGLEVFTPLAFQIWCNENDLCDGMQYNTAIEFEDFEKEFKLRLSEDVRADLYPDDETKKPSATFTSNFF